MMARLLSAIPAVVLGLSDTVEVGVNSEGTPLLFILEKMEQKSLKRGSPRDGPSYSLAMGRD